MQTLNPFSNLPKQVHPRLHNHQAFRSPLRLTTPVKKRRNWTNDVSAGDKAFLQKHLRNSFRLFLILRRNKNDYVFTQHFSPSQSWFLPIKTCMFSKNSVFPVAGA
jgi:hypothetical protein